MAISDLKKTTPPPPNQCKYFTVCYLDLLNYLSVKGYSTASANLFPTQQTHFFTDNSNTTATWKID